MIPLEGKLVSAKSLAISVKHGISFCERCEINLGSLVGLSCVTETFFFRIR